MLVNEHAARGVVNSHPKVGGVMKKSYTAILSLAVIAIAGLLTIAGCEKGADTTIADVVEAVTPDGAGGAGGTGGAAGAPEITVVIEEGEIED